MRLFLDCEFNGLHGSLISMALVSDRGAEWYCVVDRPKDPDPWVAEHVLPYLGEEPIGVKAFEHSLEAFLLEANGAAIYADWPADFEHLSRALTAISARRGFKMLLECTMHLVESGELHSVTPHNALSDARALRDGLMGLGRPQEAVQAKVGDGLLWW